MMSHTLQRRSSRARTQGRQAGDEVAHSKALKVAARSGLAARGVVYLIIGFLAIDIAVGGGSSHQANQRGAFAELASQPGGAVLLVLVVIGLAGYACWRYAQAAVGTPEDGKKAGARAKSFGRAVVYTGLCASAISVLTGSSSSSQDQKSQGWTATFMHNAAGRWLVGLAGIVVFIVGVALIVEGIRRKFRKNLDTARMSARTEKVVTVLGTVGTTARGVVFALVGILVVDAAITEDPQKSRGLDGALRTLAHQSYGPWLLGLIALGLVAFGVFGLALAKWART
jgi:TRAP-type C4-dicarboxylate transport system permease small subunit